MEDSPKCLCGVPAKSNKTKTGEVWFRCGKKINFAVERKKELVHRELGCNLRMSQEMIEELNIGEDGFDFKKDTPKCKYHHLYAKLVESTIQKKRTMAGGFMFAMQYPQTELAVYFNGRKKKSLKAKMVYTKEY